MPGAEPIDVKSGPWNHLPKGSIITGVNGTQTRWKIVRDNGLKKVRD